MLRIATTTDAGRHWDLRRLPRPAPRLIRLANFYCPTDVSCLDLVSARTWLVGAGDEPVQDHRRRALLENVAHSLPIPRGGRNLISCSSIS